MTRSKQLQIFLVLILALSSSIYLLAKNLGDLKSDVQTAVLGSTDNRSINEILLLDYKSISYNDDGGTDIKQIQVYNNSLVYFFDDMEDSTSADRILQLNDSQMISLRSLIEKASKVKCKENCTEEEYIAITQDGGYIELSIDKNEISHMNLLKFIKDL